MTTLMTLGYDAARKKFIGTFVASVIPHLWVYEGELDAAGKVLTLTARGPSCLEHGTMADYHDMIEIHGAGQRQLSSEVQSTDGKWHPFMKSIYRRTN